MTFIGMISKMQPQLTDPSGSCCFLSFFLNNDSCPEPYRTTGQPAFWSSSIVVRAVTSLTLPGEWDFNFLNSFLKFQSDFRILPQTFQIFFSLWPSGRATRSPTWKGPGYATALVCILILVHGKDCYMCIRKLQRISHFMLGQNVII